MQITPNLLGGQAEMSSCARLDDQSGVPCPESAVWHIMWNTQGQGSTACDEHMAEVQRKWVFFGRHPLQRACTEPGSVWAGDHCEVPGLSQAECVAVVGIQQEGSSR
jgi:hypothetical protein